MIKLLPLVAFSILLLAPLGAQDSFALAITISQGDDNFETDGTDTHADLPPFPSGFFGDDGSNPSDPTPPIPDFPFEGNPPGLPFQNPAGFSIGPFTEEGLIARHSTLGNCFLPSCPADTTVKRQGDAFLPNPGSMDTIPIEMVELNLVGLQPFVVTYGGTNDQFFDVFVEPAQTQTPGSMTFTRTSDNCGVFDSDLPVNAILRFENQDPNGPQAVQDLPFSDILQSTGVQWCLVMPVGGELIPIETTSLILAGSQTFSWMIPLVLSGIGIGIFLATRKSEKK